jgi:predicted transcriptional regulator
VDRNQRRGSKGKEIKEMISRAKAHVFVFLDTKTDRFGIGFDLANVPANTPQRMLLAELYAKLKHSALEMNYQIDKYDAVKKIATEKARISGRPFASVFKEESEKFVEEAKKGNAEHEKVLKEVVEKMDTPAGQAIAAALSGKPVEPAALGDANCGFVPVAPEVGNASGADKEPA